MKKRLGIKSTHPLADFLPTLTIAAKNLPAAEDIKKVERKVASEEKQIAKTAPKLPNKEK